MGTMKSTWREQTFPSPSPHRDSPLQRPTSPTPCVTYTKEGTYKYMDDLRALDCQQGSGVTTHLPPQLKIITTPLRAEAWEFFLRSHPDRDFARYLQQGIISGFRLGFQRGTLCQPSSRNLQSAYEHPDIIDRYLAQEICLQRVACFSEEVARYFPILHA